MFNSENFFNAMKENFAKISMQEFQTKIYTALEKAGVYGWLVENTEDYAIISTWKEEENRAIYIKYAISLVDEEIVLGESVEVKATYLTQEELNALDSANASVANPVVDEEDDKKQEEEDDDATTSDAEDNKKDEEDDSNCTANKDEEEEIKPATCVENEDDKKDDNKDDQKDDDSNDQKVDDDDNLDPPAVEEDDKNDDEDDFSANTQTEGAMNNASQSIVKEQENDEQMGTPATSASATALSDSEKAELENYRREEKLRMINEYKGELSDEILNGFKNEVDTFSKEQLEAKLAIEFRKFKKSVNDESNKTIMAFSLLTSATPGNYDETNSADVINRYAKKK